MEDTLTKYKVFKCGIGIIVLVNDDLEHKVIDVRKVRGFKPNGNLETLLQLRRRDKNRESYDLIIRLPIDGFAARFSQALKNCN